MTSISVLVPTIAFTQPIARTLAKVDWTTNGPDKLVAFVGVDRGFLSAEEEELMRFLPDGVSVHPLGQGEGPSGPARIRNALANISGEDCIIFVDSDVGIDSKSLTAVQERLPLLDKNSVFSVRLSPSEISRTSEFFSEEVLVPRNIGGKTFLPTAFLGIDRKLWNEVGGFDEQFPNAAGEDWEWFSRLHERRPDLAVYYFQDVRLNHGNPQNVFELARRATRYGKSLHLYQARLSSDRPRFLARGAAILISELMKAMPDRHKNRGGSLLGRALRRLPAFWGTHDSSRIILVHGLKQQENAVIPAYSALSPDRPSPSRFGRFFPRLVWRLSLRSAAVFGMVVLSRIGSRKKKDWHPRAVGT